MNNNRRKNVCAVKMKIENLLNQIDETSREELIYNEVEHIFEYLNDIAKEEFKAAVPGPYKSTNEENYKAMTEAMKELYCIIEDFDTNDGFFVELEYADIDRYLEETLEVIKEIK